MHIFIFLCSISLFLVVLGNEYCFEDLCKPDDPHIACDHTGEFAEDCPEDAKLIDMKPYKIKILNLLNGFRNKLAFGKFSGFASASRMATMTWDDELADLAAMNVQRCEMATDCHHTETFMFSGQNVFSRISNSRRGNIGQHLVLGIETWWNWYKDCTMDDINEFPRGENNIGQFTCLVAEMNTAVGCAMATFNSENSVFLLTCNFAYCNVYGNPIYVSGPTASECSTGVNPKYHGLCSKDEEFDTSYIY